jgi:hypothetical protein
MFIFIRHRRVLSFDRGLRKARTCSLLFIGFAPFPSNCMLNQVTLIFGLVPRFPAFDALCCDAAPHKLTQLYANSSPLYLRLSSEPKGQAAY